MADNKVKNIKNKIMFSDNISETNSEYNSDYEEDQNKIYEEEYYRDTIDIIQKNIFDYVERASLPLCEYLSTKDIKNIVDEFLNKQ